LNVRSFVPSGTKTKKCNNIKGLDVWNKFMSFVYSPTFSGLLALVNGYFCIQSLNAGAWGWALVSGFFTWLMAKQYLQLR